MKKALVIGAGGFIGTNMVTRLKKEGWNVTGLDLKLPSFSNSDADTFILHDASTWVLDGYYDRIYQFAADMGGAGFIFTGDSDAEIMSNSASININILRQVKVIGCGMIFYSSSACVYSMEVIKHKALESEAYPANPDSNYGWEKLFSEKLYESYAKNHNINVRVARFNNTYGPFGTYEGGREKSPAAICRKVIQDHIVIWGDGKQIRQFVYIDDLLDAIEVIINSDIKTPINIGPDESITIDGLVRILTDKPIIHTDGPTGPQERYTGNELIKSLGWFPKIPVEVGIKSTYEWIKSQYETN